MLAIALGIAFGSAELFGVSFALGAFFAGMVLERVRAQPPAAAESLPLRDAFAVLFFVSVGMLFDPSILVREPLAVLAVAARDRGRQVAGGVRDRAGVRLSARAPALTVVGQPGADRRVLVHPGRPRRRRSACCRRRAAT